jgi:hypothetical protein
LRGKQLPPRILTLVTIGIKNSPISASALTSKKALYLSRWLLLGLGGVWMIAWNWQLVLATGSGVTLMLLVYLMQGWNWQPYWLNLRQFLQGFSGKLTIAVGSGSFAALSTYVATSIWADSENRWLATGTILQGLGTLLTLALLVWNLLINQEKHQETQFEQLVNDLTDVDSLKRLIAIRRLSSLKEKGYLGSIHQQQLREYLGLMLIKEQEARVKDAILDSLGQIPPISPKSQPLPILTHANQKSLLKEPEQY